MSAKMKALRERESRWEIIRTKHVNSINVTSNIVRKFLAMDFVDEKRLSGYRKSGHRLLDPVVVMDLRHEMIKRKPKEELLHLPKQFSKDTSKIDSKKLSELSMIEKELATFKSNIRKLKSPRVSPRRIQTNKKKKKRSICIKLSNTGLFDSLEDAGGKTKDFYETAINAANEQSSIASEDALLGDEKSPNVRFQENIEVITYSRDTSTALEDEADDEIASLIDDKEDYFEVTRKKEESGHFVNCSVTTSTTTTYSQFCYLRGDDEDGLCSTTTEEAESTESSELNFYQIFDLGDSEPGPKVNNSVAIEDSLTIKSFNSSTKENPEIAVETEDLVQEIIRVKAVSNVANRHQLLRKFLSKWMHYTTIQKITKDSNLTTKSQRMTNIDAYLKKIREQKKLAKQGVQPRENASRDNAIGMVKRYQSKLKLQQDIIEVQKMKLERQERMIAELRLSRLSDDAKKFKQDLREELRNVMRTGDVRLRARAKCLQVVGDVVEQVNENQFVACGSMIPKFLAKMQERALERQLRHEQAKDRRLKLDHERDEQKQAIEDEKRRADEEAKQQRMLELQDKRRREKQEKIRKEQEREKFIEDTKKAKAFYRSWLLRRFGLDRLKKVILRKRTLELRVTNLRKRLKMKACFKAWVNYTRTVWTIKFDKAQGYYEIYLMRICVRFWRENLQVARGQMLVAVDWHEMKLNEKFFSVWLTRTREAKLTEETKIRHAEAHYKWHVLWKMLEHWQRLHSVLKLEKETEERRQRWRHKIWELLPDYTPAAE